PSCGQFRALLLPALATAGLAAIESLRSAVIADGMTGDHHDPDSELVGQGFANIIAPLFGGIAATGALARTATNIRAGAKSPIAGATHSVVVLLAILALAPAVAYVPMASLAALLLLVAWNMSELKHFIKTVRIAPKSDVSVLLICFSLTVIFDMVIAISVGFTLAAVLFMRRMAVLTDAKWLTRDMATRVNSPLPKGVVLYQINGPLFFGAVHNAMAALHATSNDSFRVLILDMGRVPVIDATGYAALEAAISGISNANRGVVLAGPLPQPYKIWEKAKIDQRIKNVHIAPDLDQALVKASELMAQQAAMRGTTGRHAAQKPPTAS
ncbi:MAG: STAS domain-containing protein, partial [Deltaproteobacteria bacterium]|nr:STAS domain-containing protein [Deltaproteobacteria bacterium]